MNCGCGCNNQGYPFLPANCSSRNFPLPSQVLGCRPNLPYLRKNFVVPPANTDVSVELTDTESLYQGEGIILGTGYYQIVSIDDSLNVTLKHNGVGVAVGTIMVAVHPSYGCYQYPITPVGVVPIVFSPDIQGTNAAGDTAVASAITSASVQVVNYGYSGPLTVEMTAEIIATIANTPYFIAIELPVLPSQDSPHPVFTAYMQEGAGNPKSAIAFMGTGSYENYLIVGPGAGVTISNGTLRKFVVSGKYDVLV